jgi:hypothetical protein
MGMEKHIMSPQNVLLVSRQGVQNAKLPKYSFLQKLWVLPRHAKTYCEALKGALGWSVGHPKRKIIKILIR